MASAIFSLEFCKKAITGPVGSSLLRKPYTGLPSGVLLGDAAAFCLRARWLALPLDPAAQNGVDPRLPARTGRAKMAEHLWRKPDVDVHLGVRLFRPAASAPQRALRRAYDFAADGDLGTRKLRFGP